MTINFNIPVYTGKEDPNHWLFRLEKIAKVNKWSDDEKMFKVELIAKHTKKMDLNKIVSDITTLKMRQGEKVSDYIDRFEYKRNAYQTEVVKRKLIIQDSKTSKTVAGETSSTIELKDDDVSELIITDTGFLRYFIKGITDKGMKRFVKSRKALSLQSLYNVLRDIYDDSDSEYDSDASHLSGETDSDEDKKRNRKASYGMEDFTAQFKDMALLLVEEIRKGRNGSTSQVESLKRKKYQGRRSVPAYSQGGTNQSNSQSESMLIEEDVLMAEKRRISEVSSSETTPQTRAKRAPRVTRSGIVYSNATAGSRIIQGIDTQRNEASSSHVALGNASNSQLIELPAIRKINVSLKQPIHPLLPIGQPGEKA
ncbi:hypothetical protein G6F42_020034 [Rhizopus arrhizus]|nr:hypothetical protein G6F42_020034 [Rhizopus arrhizus]